MGQQGTLRAGNSPDDDDDDDDDDDAGQHENRIDVDGGLELVSLLKYLWPSPSATQGSHASDSRMHACGTFRMSKHVCVRNAWFIMRGWEKAERREGG